MAALLVNDALAEAPLLPYQAARELDEEDARRREHPRQPIEAAPNYLHAWDSSGRWRSPRGRVMVVDVSEGGAGLLMEESLPVGDWVRVAVEADRGQTRFGRLGRVMYVARVPHILRWRVGISFRPSLPDHGGRIATRVVCALVLLLLWWGIDTAALAPAEALAAGIFTTLVIGLAIGAELHFRNDVRRYATHYRAWASSWQPVPVES